MTDQAYVPEEVARFEVDQKVEAGVPGNIAVLIAGLDPRYSTMLSNSFSVGKRQSL